MNHWATRLRAWVYRRSGGRILGRLGGQPVLLLQTTGRRSGQTRTTPVQYISHGEVLVIVAAAHGPKLGGTATTTAHRDAGCPERAEGGVLPDAALESPR